MSSPEQTVALPFDIHRLENNKKNCSSPQPQPLYELLWLKSGKGIARTITGEVEIHAGHVYCFRPQQLTGIIISIPLDGYYISLSNDLFYSIQQHGMQKAGVIAMDEEVQNDTETLLVKMYQEFTSHLSLQLEILKGLFKLFMLYLCRKLVNNPALFKYTRDAVIAEDFMHLLNKHITSKKMVADYARELNVTPSYLNRVVKKVSGFTASYHIQQQVVQEAKRRAMDIHRSMKEIAYDLGFDNTAHFSKFFKNNSGVNFTHFKKKLFCAPC